MLKKYIFFIILVLCSSFIYPNASSFSVRGHITTRTSNNYNLDIPDEDFLAVGVTKSNLSKARQEVNQFIELYKIKSLEKRENELKISNLMIDSSEVHLSEIYALCDKISDIENTLLKARLRCMINSRKYITKEQLDQATIHYINRVY